MEFSISDEQLQICNIIKNLCEKYLNLDIFEDDKNYTFRRDKWKKIVDIGLLGLPFDEEYGGLGMNMLTTALAIRELARGCKDEGLVFSVCAQLSATQVPIWEFGTKEQKQNYLIPLINGEMIGSSVISEPNAGSDTSSISTSIMTDEKKCVINGVKTFATLASESDVLLVYTKHSDGIKMLNVSAVILEKSKGEYEIGQIYKKTGLRTSPMCEVLLNDIHVDKNRILGPERKGMNVFFKAMIWEKILVSAYHVGAMEQQYENIYEYANQRKQFDKKIIEFEGIYKKIIDMRMRIETCRLMLYKVCCDFDNGDSGTYNSAMLKLHTSRSKLKNSLDSVDIMGAYGFIEESMVEKQMRDSLAAKIYSGTSEMQMKIMLENLGELDE